MRKSIILLALLIGMIFIATGTLSAEKRLVSKPDNSSPLAALASKIKGTFHFKTAQEQVPVIEPENNAVNDDGVICTYVCCSWEYGTGENICKKYCKYCFGNDPTPH